MTTPKIQTAGAGEKVQYLVHEFNDNTIRFVLHYPGIIDPDTLCAAAKAVVNSVDILHASFSTNTIGAYWHINQDYEDSCFFQYIETEGDPEVTACSLSLLPILPESKTQLRCCLVQSKTQSAIALNLSHLCVDGSDGKYLLTKLAEAYCMIQKNGTAAELSIKNGSRAAEQIYEGINSKEFLSLLKNPISSVKSAFPYPTEASGRIRMVRSIISESVMTAARRRAKAENATANDLLLTACYHAYALLPEIEPDIPMSIMSMMDLRRHCKNGESEGLCNMSGSLPTTLQQGIHKNFSDTLAEITQQTYTAKENPLAGLEGMPLVHGASKALPMGILMLVAGKVYGSISIGLTNLGNISCSALALGNLTPDGGVFGGPLKKKPAMQVSVISFDGACSLSVVGQYTKEDAVLLQRMLDCMVLEIQNYASGEVSPTRQKLQNRE